MRRFGTHGRVVPEKHYVVPRTEETLNFIDRIKDGKYIVLFAPRQTGKTTFFRLALDRLVAEDPTYFPIHLNFEVYADYAAAGFYTHVYGMIREALETGFQSQGCDIAIREQCIVERNRGGFLVDTTLKRIMGRLLDVPLGSCREDC